MLNRESTYFIAGGGFGDALIVLNKWKTANLPKDAELRWFTDMPNSVPLVAGLFERNGIKHTVEVRDDLALILKAHKELNITINTIWDGDVSDDADKQQQCNSDGITLSYQMDITGNNIQLPHKGTFFKKHFVVQLDAGLQYHNKRKHWDNSALLRQLGLMLSKKYNMTGYMIGASNVDGYGDDIINVSDSGFDIIDYIKGASFVIGLSSFVTLCSLMSGVPTIIKKESDNISKRYYGHPFWKGNMLEIEEIGEDLKMVADFIEKCDLFVP